MSVKHSLLALLSERDRYGYELKTEFEQRTGSAWPLNIGQVYTTLDRLQRDGLAASVGADSEGKVMYTITDAGRRETQLWFATPLQPTQPARNELAIKLALALTLPGVDVDGLIQTQRAVTITQLQNYTKAKRAADPADTAWALVVELLIFEAEAQVRWLDFAEAHQGKLQSKRRAARITAETNQEMTSKEGAR